MAISADLEAAPALLSASQREAAMQEKFSYEQPQKRPYPCVIGFIRRHIFKAFVVAVFAGSAVIIAVDLSKPGISHYDIVNDCKMVSVPLVCLLFTWGHVWMALQMVFYPLNFFPFCPCFRRCREPRMATCIGIPYNGWQGIIPNRIHKMARQAMEIMIGNVVSFDEILERVTPENFFEELREVLGEVAAVILERIMVKRFPQAWAAVPPSVKAELHEKVLQDARNTAGPALSELKANINSIVDLKEMCIDVVTKDPQVFIDIFRETAAREMQFLQHVAAVLGFFSGCMQLLVYVNTRGQKYTDYWMLPGTGLIIGYFTNWLALKMTFAPIWPHMMCCGYVNFQGVVMKRQKEAAYKLAELVCKKVIDAKTVLEYIIHTTPDGADRMLEMYQRHLSSTVDSSVGAAKVFLPTFVDQEIQDMKKDVMEISLEVLPAHMSSVERYMDDVMKVRETLGWRLARLQPPQFERVIHPIFEEDEWLLYIIGGLLGIVVGLLQAFLLQYIQ